MCTKGIVQVGTDPDGKPMYLVKVLTFYKDGSVCTFRWTTEKAKARWFSSRLLSSYNMLSWVFV